MRRARFDGWPRGMREAMRLHRSAPFDWGKSDCGLLVGDVVHAMTGWDPMPDIRGYHDERSCLTRILAAGYKSTHDLIRDRFEEIPVAKAARGDLGYPEIIGHRLMAPAVICGQFAFSKNPEHGWVILPVAAITVAFSA